MPKPHTFPTLCDEVKTISLSIWKRQRLFKPQKKGFGHLVTFCIENQNNIEAETEALKPIPSNIRITTIQPLFPADTVFNWSSDAPTNALLNLSKKASII